MRRPSKVQTWNKLVRDRIPEIIKGAGRIPILRTLDDDVEFIAALKLKLVEETSELISAEGRDIAGEIADVLEVISTFCEALGISQQEIDNVRSSKVEARGAFKDRVYLVETHDSATSSIS